MSVTPADLFERFHLAIYRYLLRMTGRRDVAEDLAQDVFVRVLGGRGRDVLDTGDSHRAWLFRVAHNLLVDWQRRAARNPVAAGSPPEYPDKTRHDVALAVREALQQLPDADREVFLLRVVGGLGHDEIAAITGSSAPSVRSRIYRARAALRVRLGASGAEKSPTRHFMVVP
jgi:RNA polymerase sigma-70 factor, ECF subfamily